MSKVICDICGTSFQDTAECCPICGCSRGAADEFLTGDMLAEEIMENSKAAEKFGAKKKQIFNYDEVNVSADDSDDDMEYEEQDYEEDDEEEEEEPRHNTFVVILLTILIAALLVAAGFIFVRYFLPNMGEDKESTVPETTVAVQTEEATVETELRIPCETLILNSSAKAELGGEGFSHLINVMPSPKDTTDKLIFVSEDPSIATVSEDGKITSVSEGETIVTISCGDVQMLVSVICDYTPETEPPTEATVAEEAENKADEVQTSAGESTNEVKDQGKKEINPNITLKLKKTDISLGAYYQFKLELDCDLDPSDVEWISEHPYVATVNEEGVVTAIMKGVATDIIVKYGDQEVRCRVRVI